MEGDTDPTSLLNRRDVEGSLFTRDDDVVRTKAEVNRNISTLVSTFDSVRIRVILSTR